MLSQMEATFGSPASERVIRARISAELHATIKPAAELQDRSVTDIVIAAVQDAANRAIAQAAVIALSMADQERFARALISPPKPNAAYAAMAERSVGGQLREAFASPIRRRHLSLVPSIPRG